MTDELPGPRRLFINGTAVVAGEGSTRVATSTMALLVARQFGPAALGDYGYALAISSVLLIVPDFGLHLYIVREIAREPHRIRHIFWTTHWLKIGLTPAVLVFAAALWVWGMGDAARGQIFAILMTRAVLQTFSQSTMAVFRALERMRHLATLQAANAVVVFAWVGAGVALDTGLPAIVAGLVAGQLLETVLGWRILGRMSEDLRPAWHHRALAPLAAASIPIGFTAILLALRLRVDVLVLSRFVGSAELGQFSAAVWFVTATFLSASLAMSVLFPKLSRVLRNPSRHGNDYASSLLKNALWLSVPGALVVSFSAPVLIGWLWGPGFGPAADTLRVLAPALPLVFLNTILFHIFVAAGKQRACLLILGTSAIVGTLLSLYMTALHGTDGCALAAVVRELGTTAMYLLLLKQREHGHTPGLAMMKMVFGASAAGALAMAIVAPSLPKGGWLASWMVLVLFGTAWTLGLPRKDEWRLLSNDNL
jgi:O-antigen/teichoic acid export membrane protein